MNKKEFENMHPITNFLYILYVMIISMITLNPYILVTSFISSIIVSVMFFGVKTIRNNIVINIPVIIFTVLIQPIFSHNGSRVLFYLNDSPVCMEAYIYGAAVAVLLMAVFRWCLVLRRLIDSEKCMYLLSRLSPTLSMILSMILRFIPLMRQRYKMIHEGQIGMGRYNNKGRIIENIRQRIKEISILITWSLENSMEVSNSMESRGYGTGKRTCYHRYRLNKSDIITGIFMTIIFAALLAEIVMGGFSAYYFPLIYIDEFNFKTMTGIILYVALCMIPLISQAIGYMEERGRRVTL